MKTRALLLVSLIVVSLFAFAGCEDEQEHPVLALEKQGQNFLSNWNNAVRQNNIDKLRNMITEPFIVVDESGTETVYAKADSFVEEFEKEVKYWNYQNYTLRQSRTTIVDDKLELIATLYYVREDPNLIAVTGMPVTYVTNQEVQLTFEQGEKGIRLSTMKLLEKY